MHSNPELGDAYVLKIEEIPALRQLWDLITSGFTSNNSWSVVCAGTHGKKMIEAFDSRYAAEQGLKRWEARRREMSEFDFLRSIEEAASGWIF